MYVLDGAMGTELEKTCDIKGTSLWSGSILKDSPELVEKVHLDYINSGSDLIISSTYQISYSTLKDNGFEDDAIYALWNKSIEVGESAIHKSGKPCKIVGSVGPWGCYVNDGSEYTGDYKGVSTITLAHHHKPLVEFLEQHTAVDFIGFETVPNMEELEAILSLDIKKKYYISFCMNNNLEPAKITKLIEAAGPNLVAIGFNCIDYRDVAKYLDQFDTKIPFIIYPNLGYSDGFQKDLVKWKSAVQQWCKYRMFAVGGCCSTGPEEIAVVRGVVDIQKSSKSDRMELM